jgi:hypothetical protein
MSNEHHLVRRREVVEKTKENRSFVRYVSRWNDNIKKDLT